MIRKMMTVAAVALLLGAVVTTTGCRAVRIADEPNTMTKTESVQYPLGAVQKVDATIAMGVGELTLSGESTTTNVLAAGFTYSPASWKPETSYDATGGVGTLRVRQPQQVEVPEFRSAQNQWHIRLAGGVLTDLDLELGVGSSKVDLSKVDVRDLHAVTGVGDTALDLSGPRTADVSARIEAGVGNLVVRLPKGVGVRVSGREDGLGDFSADGFTSRGNYWVNDSYDAAGPKIEIDLTRGIGNVTLTLVD